MMAATKTKTRRKAQPVATLVQVYCPNAMAYYYPEGFGGRPDVECRREDPIPSVDGSFLWENIPNTVTCPDCEQTFEVSKKVAV